MARCEKIASDAAAGRLVYRVNHHLIIGSDEWRTDLAIGTAPPGDLAGNPTALAGIREAPPTTVRIAVEAKAVMTRHTGARKNRKRDLEAHHQHVHNYSTKAIAAGLTVVNASTIFKSPLLETRRRTRSRETRKA